MRCEAGEPLLQAELVQRARAAMSPTAVGVTPRLSPFVRLVGGRLGLGYRDLPADEVGAATQRSPAV
ncbi:MAG TPA: hypothetical protein VFS43_25280 [Polyangiaceae bacterium]|nr:hypothetical protein [Polyangiaceae bacterium]